MEKTNRTKIYFIGIGLIIILLLIADFSAKRGLFGCFSPKLQVQKMALKYEIHRETKRYLERNQCLLADLEKKVAQAGCGNFESRPDRGETERKWLRSLIPEPKQEKEERNGKTGPEPVPKHNNSAEEQTI